MPGIEYTLGLKNEEFSKGIRSSILSAQVMGKAIGFAASTAGKVLGDVAAGFATLDQVQLTQLDATLAKQIDSARTWAEALQNPIDALLKLKNGVGVKEAFADANEQMTLNAKAHADGIQRMLDRGIDSAAALQEMAKKMQQANRVLDASGQADAAARDRKDAAEVRGGAAPEDVAARRAKADADTARENEQRRANDAAEKAKTANANLTRAKENQQAVLSDKTSGRGDADKAAAAVAIQQKAADAANGELETVKAIQKERLRGLREETDGRIESLAAEKAARLQLEADRAAKLAGRKKKTERPDTPETVRPNTDRLAQIGGYVGGAASALTNRIAERTAKATEATSKGIEKLLAYSLRGTGSFQETVF
ncbi:MAG: hypothetical protein ABIS50_15105 [Luteolibacter sp.]|uniref:hypothetical protein n=1 Tax=Luteolibacter sp. TaxID=1962973 RepID=UPI003262D094